MTHRVASPPAADPIEAEVTDAHFRHAASLLRYAQAFSHNPDTARDAVQETYLRYLTARRTGLRIDSSRAWLFRVLRNHLLDCQKSEEARSVTATESLGHFAAPAGGPEHSCLLKEIERHICAALSSRELTCFLLRARGLSYGEISTILHISTGTVGGLLSRVATKLDSLRVQGIIAP